MMRRDIQLVYHLMLNHIRLNTPYVCLHTKLHLLEVP